MAWVSVNLSLDAKRRHMLRINLDNVVQFEEEFVTTDFSIDPATQGHVVAEDAKWKRQVRIQLVNGEVRTLEGPVAEHFVKGAGF